MVVVRPLFTSLIVRVTQSATSLLCRRFCVGYILLPHKIVKNYRKVQWDWHEKGLQRRLVSDRLISSQTVHRQMPCDKIYSLLPLLLCTKGTKTLTSQFLRILNRWFHEKDRLRDSLYLYSQYGLRKITYLIAWIVWNISKSCHCKTAAGHQSAHI